MTARSTSEDGKRLYWNGLEWVKVSWLQDMWFKLKNILTHLDNDR